MKKYITYGVIGVLTLLLITSILYGTGKGVVLEEDKVTYDELQEKIVEKETELNAIITELKENKEYYDEVKELSEEHDDLADTIVEYRAEVSSLESEIEEKQNELNKANGEIVKVKDKPIKINPGVYNFGKDIDAGRYKLVPQKGYNGNVFLRGDNGFAETFGNGKYSIGEYTFYAAADDELEVSIPILLYITE